MNSVDKTISDSKDSGTLYQAFFEHAPVALLMVDFSCVKQYLQTLKLRTVPDINKHLTDFPEDVYRCFSQVRIHKSNRSSLTIFNAESEQELVDSLHQLAAPDAFESQLELILAIAGRPGLDPAIKPPCPRRTSDKGQAGAPVDHLRLTGLAQLLAQIGALAAL